MSTSKRIKPAHVPGRCRSDGTVGACAIAFAIGCAGWSLGANAQLLSGRLLASHCAQCHGTNGNAVAGLEKLAGESANEIYEELLEMKYRFTPESIMDRQAKGYTDEQLRAIAEYFAAHSAERTRSTRRERRSTERDDD